MTASLTYYDHNANSTLLAIGEDIPSLWNPYQYFNVRQYGVRGNGTSDDTVGIQACFDAAAAYSLADPNNWANILFPPSIYSFTTLTVQNKRLNVFGYGAVLKARAGSGYNQCIYVKGDVDGGNAEYINWYGLVLDANFPAVKGPVLHTNTAQSGSNSPPKIVLATAASSVDDTYAGEIIEIISGTGVGQYQKIKTYTGSTRTAEVYNPWTVIPDATSVYNIYTNVGLGFNIRANHQYFRDVECKNTKDSTFNSSYCLYVTFERCISRNAGRHAFRPNADFGRLINCEAYDWNDLDVLGNRAILCDSQEMDMEELFIENFYGQLNTPRYVTDSILIDCGDGEADGTNTVPTANSGQATNVQGKAAWTINAGHGFAPGDSLKIQESGVVEYDGSADPTYGLCHKITNITGEVFVYVVDANNIKLYKSALDARVSAGGSTGRYVLTTNGVGTMYIKSFGGRRRAFTVSDQATCLLNCPNHEFHTGRAARLTVAVAATDSLPGGLQGVALITTNTPFVSAGSNAKYWRNKRVKNVTARNITIHKEFPTTEDSAVMKVNNTNNLFIDRLLVGQTPESAAASDLCLRIGAGNRKVHIKDCALPNGFVNNTRSMIPELIIEHCEIGTQEFIPTDAVSTIQANKFHFHHNKVRFSHSGIQTPDPASQLQDRNIDFWDIHDNYFEGHSVDTIARVFDVQDVLQLRKSGLVRFYNNVRTNVGSGELPYAGSVFTANVSNTLTSTGHCLETGDEVTTSSSGTLPLGLSINTVYYVRRLGDDTFTLHTDKPGASDNTNVIDIQDTGTGTHRIHGPKVGCSLTFANPRDRGFMQRGSSGREFVGVTVPSNNSFEFQAGDIIWNMNPAIGSPQGWICIKTGVGGTTAATFAAMSNLA